MTEELELSDYINTYEGFKASDTHVGGAEKSGENMSVCEMKEENTVCIFVHFTLSTFGAKV